MMTPETLARLDQRLAAYVATQKSGTSASIDMAYADLAMSLTIHARDLIDAARERNAVLAIARELAGHFQRCHYCLACGVVVFNSHTPNCPVTRLEKLGA